MSESPETFESLLDYCIANGRAIPRDWHKLYEMLANKRQKPSGGWTPSLPLITGSRSTPMLWSTKFGRRNA
jgi:hypothetical protein